MLCEFCQYQLESLPIYSVVADSKRTMFLESALAQPEMEPIKDVKESLNDNKFNEKDLFIF